MRVDSLGLIWKIDMPVMIMICLVMPLAISLVEDLNLKLTPHHKVCHNKCVVTYVLVVMFTSLITKVTEVNVVKQSLRELGTQSQHKLHAHKIFVTFSLVYNICVISSVNSCIL